MSIAIYITYAIYAIILGALVVSFAEGHETMAMYIIGFGLVIVAALIWEGFI